MKLITITRKLKDIIDSKTIKTLKEYGIHKDADFIRKGIEPADIIFEPGERAVVNTLTTSRPDRDREIVRPDGLILDHYRKNPVVLPGHHYGGLPIGKNIWIKQTENGDGLIGKTVYSDTALGNEYYEYRKAGFPMATSIGFIPLEAFDKGTKGYNSHAKDMEAKGWITKEHLANTDRIFTKAILLEYSDVAVPSNPEALTIAVSKGFCPNGKCSVVEWDEDESDDIEWMLRNNEPAIDWTEDDYVGTPINIKALSHNSKTEEPEPAWGSISKPKLPANAFVFGATGFERDNKSTWSFPHHWVKNPGELNDNGVYKKGDLFLHVGGLNAAWAAAQGARSGVKAEKAVIDHLAKHRKALGLDEKTVTIDDLIELQDSVSMGTVDILDGDTAILNLKLASLEGAETKTIDSEGNLSIWDIEGAIFFTLNNNQSVNDSRTHIMDLYPVDYPNGHVVVAMLIENADGSPRLERFVDWQYTIEDKIATLSDAKEVTEQWALKGLQEKFDKNWPPLKQRTFTITSSPKAKTFTQEQAIKLITEAVEQNQDNALKIMATKLDDMNKDFEKQIALAKGQVVYE